MKKNAICLLMALVMLLSCGCGGAPETQEPVTTVEGAGYDSPEEAVLAYVEALRQGDVQKILSTFAIETYVEHYDLEAHLALTGAYTTTADQLVPGTDVFTTELDRALRQYTIVENLRDMYLYLSDAQLDRQPVSFNGDPYGTPEELVEDLTVEGWMQTLSKLEVFKVRTAQELLTDPGPTLQALEKHEQYLGCEELEAMAVEIMLGDDLFHLCVDVACYDGRWYNCRPFGLVAVSIGTDVSSGGLCYLDG